MWASVGGVLAPERAEVSPEDAAIADRVCEACALWDGSTDALAGMRFGDDWRVTMAVISRGEPCWDDVMRVCDAIVRADGHFLSATGHIYTDEMIHRYRGREVNGVLIFPDKDGMYQGEQEAADRDPWDSGRPSVWRQS